MPSIPVEFLALLVCPRDRAALRDDTTHLVCERCGTRYPVTDGIPDLILGHATAPAENSRPPDAGPDS